MTKEQEAHLLRVKKQFNREVDSKYRRGQREHGGDLFRKSKIELVQEALNEAVDQIVFLLTLRERLVKEQKKCGNP